MLLTFPRAGCIVYYNLYISTVFIKFGADMKQYTANSFWFFFSFSFTGEDGKVSLLC